MGKMTHCASIDVVDSKLAYFTNTYVRGFVATRPLYSDIYVYHYVYICVV